MATDHQFGGLCAAGDYHHLEHTQSPGDTSEARHKETEGRYGTQRFLSFFLKSPMHDYTQGEEAVNHLYQQYTMLKNAIREMGGYEADEEID